MSFWQGRVRLQTSTGEPIEAGGVVLRPQSQALIVDLGRHFGLVWNRPLAVLVERAGETERIPIYDVTRLAQLAVLAAVFLTSVIVVLASVSRRE